VHDPLGRRIAKKVGDDIAEKYGEKRNDKKFYR
jgi:hypothetical protein